MTFSFFSVHGATLDSLIHIFWKTLRLGRLEDLAWSTLVSPLLGLSTHCSHILLMWIKHVCLVKRLVKKTLEMVRLCKHIQPFFITYGKLQYQDTKFLLAWKFQPGGMIFFLTIIYQAHLVHLLFRVMATIKKDAIVLAFLVKNGQRSGLSNERKPNLPVVKLLIISASIFELICSGLWL